MIYNYLIHIPLYTLYRKGPWFNGYGFWAGKSDTQICSYISHVDSELWSQSYKQCKKLIEQHYESFEISVLFCVYVFMLYTIISWILQYMFIWVYFHRALSHNNASPTKVKVLE